MKNILIGLTLAMTLSSVAQANKLDKQCLTKVVNAVNKHHTLAEGSVYALKELYVGAFGAAVLVGHSDETDPTDYLVCLNTSKNCLIKSIVYSNEAGSVNEYTKAEHQTVSDIYASQSNSRRTKSLELI